MRPLLSHYGKHFSKFDLKWIEKLRSRSPADIKSIWKVICFVSSSLPQVLYNQFKFFLNLYFLVVALSQFVPSLKIGYLYTYWVPLVNTQFVVMPSGICSENSVVWKNKLLNCRSLIINWRPTNRRIKNLLFILSFYFIGSFYLTSSFWFPGVCVDRHHGSWGGGRGATLPARQGDELAAVQQTHSEGWVSGAHWATVPLCQ